MKYFNVFLFVFIANWSFAQLTLEQNTPRSCPSTVQWHEERMSKDLEYKNHIERILADRVQYMNTTTGINQNGSCANVIVIPVAVHYDVGLVPAGSEACVEDIVNQQLASLNADFASTNADVSNWSSYASCFDTSPGETCIEFCLATQNHPTGWGLNEGDPAITFGDTRFNWPNDIFGGDPLPANSDWAGYMNIFIQSGTGVLGISDGIPGNFSGTGVVVEACNFGGSETGPPVTCTGVNSGDSCGGIYDEGRTLTHEIGHYLGLFHIWGDNATCNGGQDGV
ncbi:MAG: hypothetical protein KTR13_05090, partial [Saprospiraceae bacterium]|nr:hypothetical protein [Saprospiraceae bacterium]